MDYEVMFSSRHTISLEITKDAKLLVRAPYKTPYTRIAQVVEENEKWIQEHLLKMQKRLEATPSLNADDIKKLKKQAREVLTEMTEHFSKIMGLEYGRITITSAQKCFGSCNYKKNICYSYRCMFYPKEVQEYIVVHELSHLVYMDHSKAFYELVGSVLPDYKKRASYLKLPIGTVYEP